MRDPSCQHFSVAIGLAAAEDCWMGTPESRDCGR